jgi:hypothetical protein
MAVFAPVVAAGTRGLTAGYAVGTQARKRQGGHCRTGRVEPGPDGGSTDDRGHNVG